MPSVLQTFLLAFTYISVSSHQVYIKERFDLEKFLCQSNVMVDDTTVVLSANVTHFIVNSSFYMISSTYSLMLTSDSMSPALILCFRPNNGFAFIKLHNLTLHNLEFRGCGQYLRELDVMKFINSTSPFHFAPRHSAVLLFLHIKTLFINKVNVTYYDGFAMLAINPVNTTIDDALISESYRGLHKYNYPVRYGSGMLLLFTDRFDSLNALSCTVFIRRTTF